MKTKIYFNLILLTLSFFFFLLNSFAQWLPQTSGIVTDLKDIFFTNSDSGWAVGNEGVILHTDDGGDTWIEQISGSDFDLESVHFINPDTGWIAGGGGGWPEPGIILRTIDGGVNWQEVYYDSLFYLNDVYFSDQLNGWAIGEWHWMMLIQSNILRTIDGGQNWEEQVVLPWHRLKDVQFVDSLNGWTVGGFFGSNGYPYCSIFHTQNGGITWEAQIDSLNNDPLFSVCFTDMEHGWVAGGNRMAPSSCIRRTTNGGNIWELQNSPTNRVLTSICFTDYLNGWAVGGYTSYGWFPDTSIIINTLNGGITWEYQSSASYQVLNGVYFTDPENGWIVGDSGTILHTDNGGLTEVKRHQSTNCPASLQILYYPNPFSDELTFTWNLHESEYKKIDIYNSSGEKIDELFLNLLSAGEQIYYWKPNDLPPGIYFI